MNFIKKSNAPKDQISTFDVNFSMFGSISSGAIKQYEISFFYVLNIYSENSDLQLWEKSSTWAKIFLLTDWPKPEIFKILSLVTKMF